MVCGPMAPSSAGATTARAGLTHPTAISRRFPPEERIRVGLRVDGTIVCWGRNSDWNGDYAGQADPPGGDFMAVSAGGAHSCGLRADGAIVCWGRNSDWNGDYAGQADPPDGDFTAVSAGGLPFVWFAGRWRHRLLGPQLRLERRLCGSG